MGRYRKELTHPEQELARLADEARKLRQEIQSMVKYRRRSDLRDHIADRPRSNPKKDE